ncbi:MAG: TrmB family transcriptional regulator [Roseiflexaceae bacterium]
MVVDLLQRVGFNKYEAEAYAALLQHGPLTGYELGKRSGVPLSRSYEILERLTTKGLALVQPGDPPRYAAEAPEHFLGRTRTATLATLEALAQALADLTRPHIPEGFWVVRGREPILAHARALIATAQRTIAASVAPMHAEVQQALGAARARGCRIVPPPSDAHVEGVETVLLVVDDHEAMVGTLTPADTCQVVASANPAFVVALRRFFAPHLVFAPTRGLGSAVRAREAQPLDWLDWEERKQRRLLNAQPENRVA